tara:strand:- start:88 stop:630 length:543 start_codon:yes stop_codon:yes gene_type:complete
MINYRPPYWYHDNFKFSENDLKILKSDIDGLGEKKFAKNNMHISTFFLEQTERPEKKYVEIYKKIVEDITKSVGIFYKTTYDVSFWTQLYDEGMTHNPHHHALIHPDWESVISWVHFLDVPEQKCFRFTDTKGNTLIPSEQSNGDIICFPSWVWHEVLPNKSDKKRVVISGNIKVTHYDS